MPVPCEYAGASSEPLFPVLPRCRDQRGCDCGVEIMMECSQCHATRETPPSKSGQPKLPLGWKRLGREIYCRECKRVAYALRAITIPVASCDWDTVAPVVRLGIRDATRCSNWLVSEYYARDPLRTPAGKLPKWTLPYIYPEARAMFPDFEPMSLVSLINTVQAKYRADRFDLWRHAKSLPTFRDVPLPINTQASRLFRAVDTGRWTCEFRYSGEWYTLTLRQGPEFRRQTKTLDQIAAGTAERGECALYWRDKALMLKVVGWFPRESPRQADTATVTARTCTDGFLIAVSSSGSVWKVNGDHVQRWIIGADKQQQRLREDLKAERRFPATMREGIVGRMGAMSRKRSDRLRSWSHEASMGLINWTRRQHAGTLVWDDSPDSMMGARFPWFEFATMIERKCHIAGIEYRYASDEANAKTVPPLATSESAEL